MLLNYSFYPNRKKSMNEYIDLYIYIYIYIYIYFLYIYICIYIYIEL